MKHILIVEDDVFLSKIYREGLESYGYEVEEASNGVIAIELLKNSKPDLIVLDLVMPRMNGMETLKRIKGNSETKNIPVIIASNLGQSSDVNAAMKNGASDYVVKTDISIKELTEKIDKFLKKS